MPPDPVDAFRPLFGRLVNYLRDRPEVRAALADLGRVLLACADAAEPAAAESADIAPVVEPVVAPDPQPPPPVDLSQLDLAAILRSPPPIPSPPPPRSPGEIIPVPFPEIARRCRLKAEAARLVATAPGAFDRILGNDLVARAGAMPECFLWMLDLGGGYSDRPAVWSDLARAYEAAAATADLLHR